MRPRGMRTKNRAHGGLLSSIARGARKSALARVAPKVRDLSIIINKTGAHTGAQQLAYQVTMTSKHAPPWRCQTPRRRASGHCNTHRHHHCTAGRPRDRDVSETKRILNLC
jgi:hypothetical protein